MITNTVLPEFNDLILSTSVLLEGCKT